DGCEWREAAAYAQVGGASRTSLLLFVVISSLFFFFFKHPATTEIYTLSLHDALPICGLPLLGALSEAPEIAAREGVDHLYVALRSEEHTSELQSRFDLVCRLLLEKKKKLAFVAVP